MIEAPNNMDTTTRKTNKKKGNLLDIFTSPNVGCEVKVTDKESFH